MILDDADTRPIEGGLIAISYNELVDGYRHAYRVTERGRTKVKYSRTRVHPEDSACPECAAS